MKVTLAKDAKASLYSFSTRDPRPPACQFVFDVSNLRDPYGQASLRSLDGRNGPVQSFLSDDPRVPGLLDAIVMSLKDQLSGSDPSNWVSVGVCDMRGTHIAPAVVELASNVIEATWEDLPYLVRHFHWIAVGNRQ